MFARVSHWKGSLAALGMCQLFMYIVMLYPTFSHVYKHGSLGEQPCYIKNLLSYHKDPNIIPQVVASSTEVCFLLVQEGAKVRAGQTPAVGSKGEPFPCLLSLALVIIGIPAQLGCSQIIPASNSAFTDFFSYCILLSPINIMNLGPS